MIQILRGGNMNLPNKLTVFRILLVPIMVIIPFLGLDKIYTNSFIPLTWLVVEAIFVIASITDKLDGHIARSRNQITTFGKFLDPIADKILVLAAMIMLVEAGRLPAWIPIIVLFREFVVSGYRLIAVENDGKVIAASVWGKLKTVTQMIALIIALVDMNCYGAFIGGNLSGLALVINVCGSVVMTISVIATIFSGWDYVKNGKELLKNM
jgi:CDP-diacylglycerol--glycerol-3-phosphate 3-phosphatidyltransferase